MGAALLRARGYYRGMKRNLATWSMAVLGAVALWSAGCGRQSRGNADAMENRARSPQEGANTSTAGSAGEAKNFGDTSRSGAHGGVTNPETPKQNAGPSANRPEQQPQKSTEATSETAPQPGQSATSGTSLVGEKK